MKKIQFVLRKKNYLLIWLLVRKLCLCCAEVYDSFDSTSKKKNRYIVIYCKCSK